MVSPATQLVVYIEDNDANFALVKRVLEVTGGYQVIRAVDGHAGLRLIKQRKPTVLLLDLDLPGITGIEVARRIRKDQRLADIPIVIVTASVMKRERHEAMDAGADFFVEKPFEIARLREVVAEAAQGRRLG